MASILTDRQKDGDATSCLPNAPRHQSIRKQEVASPTNTKPSLSYETRSRLTRCSGIETRVSARQKYVHSLFQVLDTDKDGLIEIKEVATLLRGLGQNPTSTELKGLEENVEKNVDFDAALRIIEKIGLKSLEEEEEELRIAFRAIDRDDSGTITKAELKRYLCLLGEQMSEEEVDELMEIGDINKDGVIDYNEFVAVLAAHIM